MSLSPSMLKALPTMRSCGIHVDVDFRTEEEKKMKKEEKKKKRR